MRLQPFEADELHIVEPWFHDAETRRWLGGPEWPRRMLELQTSPLREFRGAQEIGRFQWLGWEDQTAVGYINCGTFDRWTAWEGGEGGRGVVSEIPVASAGICYVVDPELRGRGYCARMIAELMRLPELNTIGLFAAGIEPDNVASAICLRSAGFEPLDAEPDWEGIVYYGRRTTPR